MGEKEQGNPTETERKSSSIIAAGNEAPAGIAVSDPGAPGDKPKSK